MKKYIVLLCLLPVIAAGQNISIGKKQVNFAPGFPQVFKGGVEYLPTTNTDYLNKDIYVQKIGDTIRFASNFSDTTDLWIDFLPLTSNRIYNLVRIAFHPDTSTTKADHNLTGRRTVYKTNTTDVIGPYSLDDHFIGGAHLHLLYNYEGTTNKLPTGISDTPVITGSSRNGLYYSDDSIVVKWNNYLYKYSTIQDIGVRNGDTLIREEITLSLFPQQISIQDSIYFTEQTTMGVYYGLQWSNINLYNDSVHFLRGEAKGWETFANAESGNEGTAPDYVGWLDIADNRSHRVLGLIDQEFGLGQGGSINNWAVYNKGFTSSTKTYAYLINNATYPTSTAWRGDWLIKPEIDFKSDFYTTFKRRGQDRLIASFTESGIDTFNVGESGKILKIHSKDSTLKLDNSFPLIITSSGYGVLEADIIDNVLPTPYASYDHNYGITINNGITAINDQGSNNKDLSVIGSPKLLYAPSDSSCIKFDGIDDRFYRTAANSQVFASGSNQSITIDFDIKTTEKIIARYIAYYYSSGAYYTISMKTDGFIDMTISDGTNTVTCLTGINSADGDYHHFTCVINRETDLAYIYMDGAKLSISEKSIASVGDIINANASFGWNQAGTLECSSRHLNFYTKALTSAEVMALYNYYKK